jgi:putative oxidoreductase
MGKCKKWCDKYGKWDYLIFRVLFGLLFFMHGYAKFAGGTPEGKMLLAAVIEVVVGAAVFLGFFTRLAATLGALLMAVAYFTVHAGQGLSPLANGGELAVLYFAGFLAMTLYGNGKYSLEQSLLKKETF